MGGCFGLYHSSHAAMWLSSLLTARVIARMVEDEGSADMQPVGDYTEWDHLVNQQFRPEHQRAKYLAFEMYRRGVTQRQFTSIPILLHSLQWRERIAALPEDFAQTVDAVADYVSEPNACYIWAIYGDAMGFSRQQTVEMARGDIGILDILNLVTTRKYSVRVAYESLMSDIDGSLLDMLSA